MTRMRFGKSVRLVAAAWLLTCAPAAAIEIQVGPDRSAPLRLDRSLDLNILRSQQRRLDFQREQRQFREQDRDAAVRQQNLDLDISRFRQSCPPVVNGGRYRSGGCR